ncbi:unnamed protein product, partial [Adineta ricciae]
MDTDVVLLPPEAPLTSETVKFLLQSDKEKYTIIRNETSTLTAEWWRAFGYPSKLGENGEHQRTKGFISCFKFFNTFIYNSSSGTARLNQHGFKKNSKLSDKETDNIKHLSAQWICHDLRPFSTIDDIGFRNLAQELIRI